MGPVHKGETPWFVLGGGGELPFAVVVKELQHHYMSGLVIAEVSLCSSRGRNGSRPEEYADPDDRDHPRPSSTVKPHGHHRRLAQGRKPEEKSSSPPSTPRFKSLFCLREDQSPQQKAVLK